MPDLTNAVLGFPVYQLRHEEAFEFYPLADELAVRANLASLGVAKTRPKFTAALKKLDAALQPALGSALTLEIKKLDDERDLCYRALREGVAAQRHVVNTDSRHDKALQLQAILDRYKTRKHLDYLQETGTLRNLLEDFDAAPAKDYVEQLSLTPLVEAARVKNHEFETKYRERLQEALTTVRANIPELRAETDSALANMLQVIRGGAAEEQQACRDFLVEYAALVAKCKTLIAQHKSTGHKRTPAAPPDGEAPAQPVA
ncbi:MAG: DUF6261 family protein [Verrucomicrobiales bacterium]|jgi:hypothetical protein|nr:DUF6261 family protein [Verrucomicrobiales bacterium]